MSNSLWTRFQRSCAWFFCKPAYPFNEPQAASRTRRHPPSNSSPNEKIAKEETSGDKDNEEEIRVDQPGSIHRLFASNSSPEDENIEEEFIYGLDRVDQPGIRFKVALHDADAVDRLEEITCAEDVLRCLWQPMTVKEDYQNMQTEYLRCKDLYQSSMGNSKAAISSFMPKANGFVHTVLQAYNEHHELIIRPDDIWISIICQLNLYVNANSESLRSYFVTHEGQKTLILEYGENVTRHSLDYKIVARDFSNLLRKEIIDSAFVDTILPNFTTTTENDTTICSAVMMSTLKAYFTYEVWIRCGIPAITLLGTKSDYEIILAKLDKLDELGAEVRAFTTLLRHIIHEFIATFEAISAGQEPNIDFWSKICHEESMGSGPNYLSGWLTSFCVWDKDGKWQGLRFTDSDPVTFYRNEAQDKMDFFPPAFKKDQAPFDTSEYGRIDTDKIPVGFSDVEVKVVETGTSFDCIMVAGHVGARVTGTSGIEDTLQPSPQWFMFEVEKVKEKGPRY